jgi:very-short-patch-repair endonuclease
MKCPDCGFEKPMNINNLRNQGFGCPRCSDGKSYPNKFMFNVLDQINNLKIIGDFENEKTFNWLLYRFKEKLRQGRIDFYLQLNDKEYGIEMDGSFHTKDNNINGQTKEESKYIDDEKDRLCLEHGIKIIRINCEKSELEWIKNSIMQSELPKLLNFKENNVNWLKCHEYACSNVLKEACQLWDNGNKKITKIANILKLDRHTIAIYLKQGAKLGWCDYKPKKIKKSNSSVQLICLTTNTIYNSLKEACDAFNLKSKSGISQCCSNKKEFAGRHPITNEKLRWAYYDKNIK